MYSQFQLEPLSTYPFDVSRLSTGSALTAAHFCQTATKVSKKASPYHTAASPGLGGALTPALLWAFASPEQSHYKNKSKSKSKTNLGQIHVLPPIRPAGRPPRRALLWICPPSREAEWRFCAVGRPAWMPGEPCWAMDGPSRRAHGAGPERGNLSAAKAVRWGEDLLVPFGSFQKGLAVRAKPIFQL